MGLFTRKPLYNDFTISGGRGNVELFAHFTSAARGKSYTLPPHAIKEALQTSPLHPHDRALLVLALDQMKTLVEELTRAAEYETYIAQRNAREKRLAFLLEKDRCDLRAPDRPYRRHLIKDEPPRRYKSHTLLTGTPENIRVALKLIKPEMIQSFSPRMLSPRFAIELDEHRLLYEHNNNKHLNYDDQVMVHEALLELRAYKIQNDLPVIPLRPTPSDTPPHTPDRPRYRRYGIYF